MCVIDKKCRNVAAATAAAAAAATAAATVAAIAALQVVTLVCTCKRSGRHLFFF